MKIAFTLGSLYSACIFSRLCLCKTFLKTTDLEEKQNHTAKHVKHFKVSFFLYVNLFFSVA